MTPHANLEIILKLQTKSRRGKFRRMDIFLGSSESPEFALSYNGGANYYTGYTKFSDMICICYAQIFRVFYKNVAFLATRWRKKFFHKNKFCSVFIMEQS